jgi:hypothetical protein
MTQMLIDGVRAITLHGNVVRITCVSLGPEGKQEDCGTLVIPGPSVGGVMQTLVNGLQEMQKQIREKTGAAAAEPPKAN